MNWRNTGEQWRNLRPFLPARSGLRIGVVGLASFLSGLAESGVLVLITLTADSLIRGTEGVNLAGLTLDRRAAVLLALGCVIVRVLLGMLASLLAARFSSAVMLRAQQAVVAGYLRGSYPARASRQPGDLAAVVTGHGRFTGDLATSYTAVVSAVCGLVAFGGTSLLVNPAATGLISAYGALLFAALTPLRRRSKAAANEFSVQSRVVSTAAAEIEKVHREIEIFQARPRVEDSLGGEVRTMSDQYFRVRFIGAVAPQMFQAAVLGAAVISMLFIADDAGRPSELASVGTVVLLLMRSMTSAQQLVMSGQRVLEFGAFARGLNELIEMMNQSVVARGVARPASILPVALENLSFAYDEGKNVLTGVSTTLRVGEVIGVVGSSGAGKTTLMELILGLRAPSEGRVVTGDIDWSEVAPELLAERVAFVPQHSVSIRGSVADNVRFYRDFSDEEVGRALRLAHLDDEVREMPQGIHTQLGPDERSLSGGQLQRLSIARALVGRPELLVLDEPTSALDATSERAIRRTLDELPDDMAVVIVAHRYSTLRSCDRILVLADGRIASDGPLDRAGDGSALMRLISGGEAEFLPPVSEHPLLAGGRTEEP